MCSTYLRPAPNICRSKFFSPSPHRPVRKKICFHLGSICDDIGNSVIVVPYCKYLFKSVRDVGIIRFPCVSRTFPLRLKRINEKIADETRTEPLLIACTLLTYVITIYIYIITVVESAVAHDFLFVGPLVSVCYIDT